MGIVKSIEFTNEDSGNGQETTPSIVGTWVYSYSDTWDNITSELGTDTETLYIQFGADGTILRVEIKKNSSVTVKRGSWKLINNYLTITLNGYSTAFDIIDIQSNSLVLSVLGMIVYYERVSDSEIEKYL